MVDLETRPQGAASRRRLDRLEAEFASRVLPVDDAVARRAAMLHFPDPDPAPEADAYTALMDRLTLATGNTRDFAGFDELAVLYPRQAV